MTTKGGWRREGACGDATQSSHKGSRLRLSIFSKHIWIWEVRFDIHEQAIGWQMPDALYNNEKLWVPGWFRVIWSWIVEKMWHVTEDVYTLLQRHKAAPFRPWKWILSQSRGLNYFWVWSLKRHSIMRRAGELQACWSFRHVSVCRGNIHTVHTVHICWSIMRPVELACLLPWRNLVGCTSWVPTHGTEEQDRGNFFQNCLAWPADWWIWHDLIIFDLMILFDFKRL